MGKSKKPKFSVIIATIRSAPRNPLPIFQPVWFLILSVDWLTEANLVPN